MNVIAMTMTDERLKEANNRRQTSCNWLLKGEPTSCYIELYDTDCRPEYDLDISNKDKFTIITRII